MNYISPQRPQSPRDVLRPAAGTAFALIDQTPVLFSEREQKLFELNDVAAFIWCSLQDAVPLETICDQLVDRGLSLMSAREYLRDALVQWLSVGLIYPECPVRNQAFTATVGRKLIEVRASEAESYDHLRSLFVATGAPTGKADAVFSIHHVGDSSIIMHDNQEVCSCPTDQLVPTFKACVVERMLLAGDPSDVIFHAAAVISHNRAILISAPPGTGKSTLTMHMLHAGFRYVTDDIVIIGMDGTIIGTRFAPTLKSGSWPSVSNFRPGSERLAVHQRQDGQAVRYLDVGSDVHEGAVPVGWIIFLERSDGCTAPIMTELGELETIQRIVAASYSTQGTLTSGGFRTLKDIVSRARSFVLRYTEAADVVGRLVELGNDQP